MSDICEISGLAIDKATCARYKDKLIHPDVARMIGAVNEDKLIKLAERIFLHNFGKDKKPSWDEYFLTLARIASSRSIDPNTKHGCVIVDKSNRIISMGYNGPPPNFDDAKIPLTRPKKYLWMIHAEENAMLFANRSLEGCTIYGTGRPCVQCLRRIIQVGIDTSVHGPVESKCIDEEDLEASNEMIKQSGINVREVGRSANVL